MGKRVLPADPAGRLAHRALHAAARGHVHVPLALQRDAAEQLRAVRPDRGARAGRDVRPGDGPGAGLQRRRPVVQLRSTVHRSADPSERAGDPAPIELRAGTTYRFRLINILTETGLGVALLKGEEPVAWRAVAKDGADLPPSQATGRPARLRFDARRDLRLRVHPRGRGRARARVRKGQAVGQADAGACACSLRPPAPGRASRWRRHALRALPGPPRMPGFATIGEVVAGPNAPCARAASTARPEPSGKSHPAWSLTPRSGA